MVSPKTAKNRSFSIRRELNATEIRRTALRRRPGADRDSATTGPGETARRSRDVRGPRPGTSNARSAAVDECVRTRTPVSGERSRCANGSRLPRGRIVVEIVDRPWYVYCIRLVRGGRQFRVNVSRQCIYAFVRKLRLVAFRYTRDGIRSRIFDRYVQSIMSRIRSPSDRS